MYASWHIDRSNNIQRPKLRSLILNERNNKKKEKKRKNCEKYEKG